MAANPKAMSKVKQILRLHNDGMSNRRIAETLDVYKGTVNKYVNAAKSDGTSIARLLEMDDMELERRLCGGNAAYTDLRFTDLSKRLADILEDLKDPHVTMYQLWREYRSEVPNGYGYTQFCYHIGQHHVSQRPSMVLCESREGGNELFVDFAGDPMSYVDRETGEEVKVQVFVACLPASDYGFAMAVRSQKVEDFLMAIEQCLRHIGGVPRILVTDNLKSAVIKADRYQPELNQIMDQFANHYGFAVIPARSARPKDKALVENHVKLVYRNVYAPLRNQTFFSIDDLNEAIFEKMHQHNQKRMQQHPFTREERFLSVDKPRLGALKSEPFEIRCETRLTVQGNSHILFGRDKHYYSVPYKFIGQKVRVIYTSTLVMVYSGTEQIAVHARDTAPGRYTTVPSHVPSHTENYVRLSPQKYIERAQKVSRPLSAVFERMFSSCNGSIIPEKFYKSCDGLIHIQKTCDPAIFDLACEIALEYGQCKYMYIKRLVETKCSGFINYSESEGVAPQNDNIRGKDYFKNN